MFCQRTKLIAVQDTHLYVHTVRGLPEYEAQGVHIEATAVRLLFTHEIGTCKLFPTSWLPPATFVEYLALFDFPFEIIYFMFVA